MYQTLVDTVSDILRHHGIDILTEAKFWYVLTDTYPFASDYSLRDMFRRCISKGYVAEIASLKDDRRSTVDMINKIIKQENLSGSPKRDELKAVLYSVAVGLGTCDSLDYYNHDIISSEESNKVGTATNPIPCQLSGDDEDNLSARQAGVTMFMFMAGLFFSLVGVFLYKFLYGEYVFGLGGIVLLTGIFQFFFTAVIGAVVFSSASGTTDGVNEHFRTPLLSILFPIFVSFILNSLFSLLFFIPTFVKWLGVHIYGSGIDIPNISANIFNFFVSLAYFIFIGGGCMKCYDESVSEEIHVDILFNMHKWLDSKIVGVSSFLVIVSYLILFFYPVVMNTPL